MTAEGYDIIAESRQSTVVAHYERDTEEVREGYQSEAELEQDLIGRLQRQGYEYVKIHSEEELVANLRRQLETLNRRKLSDAEWQRLFKGEIANENKDISHKTRTIQQDHVKTLRMDDGTERNIYLINKRDIHANLTQVMNQYVPTGGARENRYDVTILVNGLPLVHIELKRRGRSIREAFNQIERYGRESFWAGCGLFEYVQLFVISNGTQTKYYSNTTREGHIRERGKTAQRRRVKASNSYEFTSYWADGTNKVLNDLTDFTATFFSRHTLLSVLTRYCVFTEQETLMAMRPYQIAATERLLNQIEKAHNARLYGKREAGGYIWHTTGSGKTLTSFKAAQLATGLAYVDKVVFVVDRKDLDYQTMREYDRFEKGAANGNTSTAILARQMEDSKSRIIITTIQKLSTYVKKNERSDVFGKEVVFIFDECHRSQFGEMHKAITGKFKRYYLFGFTGTPIFDENKSLAKMPLRTTDDVFGTRLHTYTIVDAIRDKNVLPFRIAYIRTMRQKEEIENSKVWDIDREKALRDPKRIANVTAYILKNFATQTKRSETYTFSQLANIREVVAARGKGVEEVRRKANLAGFNSIMAVQSIEFAKLYYNEFKRQMEALPPNQRLRVATIFSYAPNEEVADIAEEEDCGSTTGLDNSSRDFLNGAIGDYNQMFGTSYDTGDKFPNYYKDVSQRMKNRELDLLIVVNMFLTGFDATTLNTLWADKNLRYHGLLQAFSRTNRILNSVKVVGNIVCFRNLEDATNRALSLFGDKEAHSVSILRPFNDYFRGYTDEDGKHVKGYVEYVKELTERFTPGGTIDAYQDKRDFVRLFGAVLRMRNLLGNFEAFGKRDPLSEADLQDYTSTYIMLSEEARNKKDKEDISDDLEFEMELVKHVEVNIDYILYLVSLYHESHCKDTELKAKIMRSIDSSPDLRDKRELLTNFIASLTPDSNVDKDWRDYVNASKRKEYETIIKEEELRRKEAIDFIETAFQRGRVPDVGLELNNIMPPIDPFDSTADFAGRLRNVLGRIRAFFNKFFDVANGDFK